MSKISLSKAGGEQQPAQIVGAVRRLLRQHGFCAFGSREQTEAFLRRQFPGWEQDVAACTAVLYLPRYLDCLKALTFDGQTGEQTLQYWAYFERCIEASDGDTDRMRSINRLFLLG